MHAIQADLIGVIILYSYYHNIIIICKLQLCFPLIRISKHVFIFNSFRFCIIIYIILYRYILSKYIYIYKTTCAVLLYTIQGDSPCTLNTILPYCSMKILIISPCIRITNTLHALPCTFSYSYLLICHNYVPTYYVNYIIVK